MFTYAENYESMKKDLFEELHKLKIKGYHILTKKHNIYEDLSIDKIIIKSKKDTVNRLVFSTGLHGIEGYVGHSCIKLFFRDLLGTISPSTEVIIYHGINPYGIKNYRRTNENNVDLNRNFSKNNFSSTNEGFEKVRSFFTPKTYRSPKSANIFFYSSLAKLIAKHGIKTLRESTLMGQKSLKEGVCYSGEESQTSTKFILEELKTIFDDIENIVWIDLHTGYGPRYQMSIVNSQYEKTTTSEMVEEIQYPLILGLNAEDFYEIDGDMLEKTYNLHKESKSKAQLYATCFEFGTLGDSTKNSISSLKALVFENDTYYSKQTDKFKEYSRKIVKEQFLPSSPQWRRKAEKDFIQATKGIISYKGI